MKRSLEGTLCHAFRNNEDYYIACVFDIEVQRTKERRALR